jgi:hypothetical protein
LKIKRPNKVAITSMLITGKENNMGKMVFSVGLNTVITPN